jgi:predicted metalloprotease
MEINTTRTSNGESFPAKMEINTTRTSNGESFPAKMVAGVQSNPGKTLALILVLVMVVLYMWAKGRGMFGLGSQKPPHKNGKKKAHSRRDADVEDHDDDADELDPETAKLVRSINSSSSSAKN